MRKILIGGAMVSVLIVVLLIYNHKQLPTFEDVIKFTENWSIPTEEVKMLVFSM